LHRLPHHVSFCVSPPPCPASAKDASKGCLTLVRSPTTEAITGRTLVRQLNLAGIGISAGAACNSGKLNPSPILKAMGYSDARSLAGIRLTLGRDTTLADIEWTAMVLKQILKRL
jgi:cysteine desulfurase